MAYTRRPVAAALAALVVLRALPVSAQSLGEIIEAALSENLRIASADLAVRSAELEADNAQSARLPEIRFQGSASYLTNPPEGIRLEEGSFGSTAAPGSLFPTPIPDEPVVLVPDPEPTFFQLKATVSQPVFTWGKLENASHIAELQRAQSRVEANAARSEVVRDIRSAWAALRMLEGSLELIDRMAQIYGEIVNDKDVNFEQGLINFQEVLEARYRLAGIESRRTEIRESRASAINALEAASGLGLDNLEPRFTPLDLEEMEGAYDETGQISMPAAGEYAISSSDEGELFSLLETENGEILSLELSARMASLNEKISEASRLLRPDVGLNIEIETSGQRIPFSPNWRETWDSSATISLGVSGGLWDWGQSENDALSASIQSRRAENGLALLRQGQQLSLRNLVQRHNLAVARYAENLANRRYLDEQFKNARVSFDNDLLTREELLGSELLSIGARLEGLAQLLEYETVRAEIDFLTGADFDG